MVTWNIYFNKRETDQIAAAGGAAIVAWALSARATNSCVGVKTPLVGVRFPLPIYHRSGFCFSGDTMTPVLILLAAALLGVLGWWLSRRGAGATIAFLVLLGGGLLLVWASTGSGQQVVAAGTCGLVVGNLVGSLPATVRRARSAWGHRAPVESAPREG